MVLFNTSLYIYIYIHTVYEASGPRRGFICGLIRSRARGTGLQLRLCFAFCFGLGVLPQARKHTPVWDLWLADPPGLGLGFRVPNLG